MTLLRVGIALGRTGAIGAAFLGTAIAIAQPLAYAQLAGTTAEERAIFARQMTTLGRQFLYILPVPSALDTMAGWLEWRALGVFPPILAFWALVAATGAGRGDEDRGLVEHWLAQGVSRARYALTRLAAFASLGVVVIATTLAAAEAGTVAAGAGVPPLSLAAQGVPLLGLTLCCFTVALLAAQLAATRRAAAGIAAAALGGLYLLNVAGRAGSAPLRDLSPFALYDRQHALLRSGELDLGATLALYGAGAALASLAILAFLKRDLGAAALARPRAGGGAIVLPARDPLLGLPVLALLDQQRWSIAAWSIGLSGMALFFLSFTRSVLDAMLATPGFGIYLERAGLLTYTSFIGSVWLSTLLLLLSIYAIAQAAGWAAEDADGRLEIALAQPVSRARIVVERLAALVGGSAVAVFASAIAVVIGAAAADIALDGGRLALGTALTLAVVFAFGGLGAAGAGWRPRATVALLAALAMASYLIEQFAPLFGWPPWIENLSLFALYGHPLTGEVDWMRIGALFSIGMVGSLAALVAMRRRDVGR